MIKIYGDMLSGNCYKIALLCSFIGLEHEWIHVDILAGEARSEDFSKLNPNQKVPLLVLENGECIWESNAILNYLAHDTEWLPSNPLERARVLQWQFFEQYSHEPYIAVARYINIYLGLPENRRAEFDSKQEGGNKALAVMEKHLENNRYLVGNSISIADLSLFAYTHVADEGGFDLAVYPNIQKWLSRITSAAKFIPMERDTPKSHHG
mgnify:CR=1 FL=1